MLFQVLKIITCFTGTIWIALKCYPLIVIFIDLIFPIQNQLKIYGHGSWALITGATDGIGKGFCNQLGRRGFNLILVSRNESKLKSVQDQIQKRFPLIKIIYIKADFNESNQFESFYDQITKRVSGLDVSMLINNVGTSHGGSFLKISNEQFNQMIVLNCYPIVYLTKALLPQLLQRQNKSAIINVSSVSAQMPMGFGQVYSATKVFDDYFTRALEIQLKHFQQKQLRNQIDIQLLRPCAVTTPLTRGVKRFGSVLPDSCAKHTINQLGRRNITNGHPIHRLQSWSTTLVPEKLIHLIFAKETKEFFQYCQQVDNKKID